MSDVAASVKTVFDGMPQRLNPDAAEGLDAIIQYELAGDGGAVYQVEIREGRCTGSEGEHEEPSMTLSMAACDFVDLIEGRLDGMSAFMSGKLQIGGDMGLAMRMQSLFEQPASD